MECDRIDPSKASVRQGDIIAAHPATKNWSDRWRRFFVVMSADCDIAQQKTETGLVVVPIVGLRTYIADIWLPTQIEKVRIKGIERVEPLLNRFAGRRLLLTDISNMSPSDLEVELRSRAKNDTELEQIVSRVTDLYAALRSLPDVLPDGNRIGLDHLPDALSHYFDLRDVLTGNKASRESDLLSGLAALSDPRRADTWSICDLIGLDGQMREDESNGFVACLRRFSSMPLDLTYVEKAAWLRDEDGYYRICRLRGIYKSDLVQKFANLFSRIGLEDEREAEHHRIYQQIAASLILRKGK